MSSLQYLFSDAVQSKGWIEYFHDGKSRPFSAFEKNGKNSIKIKIPTALGATEMRLEIFDESGKNPIFEQAGEYLGRECELECFSFVLDYDVGLYYAMPKVKVFSDFLLGRKQGNEIIFDGCGEKIQFSISDFKHTPPSEIYGGIIYHVFVDRFSRGGNVKSPDYARLVEGEWEVIPEYPEYPGAPLKNNTFYGGNLYGIIDKLDYISSLGVSALYLSPIFESVSNHKYDTADYMKVDSGFGGDEALKTLISEAKKRNIKIILDGVFNHTGSDSVYFNRKGRYSSLGAYQSKDSEFYGWYDFKEYPDKYTCWWDIDILPRINPDKPDCRSFFVKKDGVISKYKNMGIYGLRLDVADELSDGFIEEIKTALSEKGETVLYGEVWEDASNKIAYGKRKHYYLGKELDGVMNYPLRRGLIEYVLNKNYSELLYVFNEVFVNTPERILHAQMNFLGTHDTDRILTVLGGESDDGHTNAELCVKRMVPEVRASAEIKLSGLYTVLATLPGVPTIFYGDEAGLEGYHDPFNRMPYPWGKESASLINHYVKVGEIRRNNSVYERGDFKVLRLDSDIFVFERFDGNKRYVTVLNNSDKTATVEFSTKVLSLLGSIAKKKFELAPFVADIFKVNKKTSIDIFTKVKGFFK